MKELKFDESQILIINEQLNQEDVLKKLADLLNEKGYAKESYYKAVCEREKIYPTGLFTGDINVAIPHCDISNVNEGSICIGILKKPTQFARMDEPDTKVDVHFVVMLALTEPHGHIEMLQKIISLIQNQEIVHQIIESNNEKEIYGMIKTNLF